MPTTRRARRRGGRVVSAVGGDPGLCTRPRRGRERSGVPVRGHAPRYRPASTPSGRNLDGGVIAPGVHGCWTDPVHIVVVGCGRVGSGLAVSLTEEGHTVAILDRSARAFRRLPGDWSGQQIVGSGFDRDDLERAGAVGAGALAAVTSGDNTNILTVRIARETYKIPRVAARIYDPRRAAIYQRLGIPTVATVTWTIDQMRRRLLPEAIATEWADASGVLRLVERRLPDRWAGRRLLTISEPGRITLVAVTRSGIPHLDVSTLIGQEGDVLLLAVSKDALAGLDDALTEPLLAEGGPAT